MVKGKLWLLIVLAVLTGCGSGAVTEEVTESKNENRANVYLLNGAEDTLVVTEVALTGEEPEEMVTEVMDHLFEGKPSEGLSPVLKSDGVVDKVEVSGSNAQVHMTTDFEAMKEVEMLICRSAIIKSVTSVEGIEGVEFYVDGLPMKDSKGKVYGTLIASDIIIDGKESNRQSSVMDAVIYYPDDQGEQLKPYVISLEVPGSESIELTVLKALIYGTPPEGVQSPIPEGTRINHIDVNNGICYIDLNSAFRSNHYGGSTGEMMTVYSIVNTMTELPYINRVQFLIDGERTETYKGHLDFTALFEYNLNLTDQ